MQCLIFTFGAVPRVSQHILSLNIVQFERMVSRAESIPVAFINRVERRYDT